MAQNFEPGKKCDLWMKSAPTGLNTYVARNALAELVSRRALGNIYSFNHYFVLSCGRTVQKYVRDNNGLLSPSLTHALTHALCVRSSSLSSLDATLLFLPK